MKRQLFALVLIIIALAVLGLSNAHAYDNDVKVFKKPELVAIDLDSASSDKPKCMDNIESMADCRSFIKGFLQGALLTDTAIIKSFKETEPTFSERAIRTRLGSRFSNSPTALAGFCLPEKRSILSLAEETLDHVKASERNSVELAKNVYNSLKVDYPCT